MKVAQGLPVDHNQTKKVPRMLATYDSLINIPNHEINLRIKLRMQDHGYKKYTTSQRVSYVSQLGLTRLFQNIINDSWDIIIPYLIPAKEKKMRLHFNNWINYC